MKNIKLCLLALVGMGMFACQKSETDSVETKQVILKWENLDSRLHTDNAGVVGTTSMAEMPENFYSSASVATKSAMVAKATDVASDFPMALVAEVDAPVYDGVTLQATHVWINGNYAYVCYNVKGDRHLGAVDVIDITDPNMPQVAAEAIFPTMDVNSIALKDGILYMVGARDIDGFDGVSSYAVLAKMTLDGNMLSENVEYVELSSYAGTALALGGAQVYCASGSAGDLFSFNFSDGAKAAEVAEDDLRALCVWNGDLIALSGTTGIHVYSASTMVEKYAVTLPTDVEGAKRTIDYYCSNFLVAQGFGGLGIYKQADGTLQRTLPVETVSDDSVDPEDLVCNSVTTTDNHILMGQGAAGVVVYKVNSGDVVNAVSFGSLALEGSANYVESGSGCLFVADGTGGLKILKMLTCTNGSEEESDGSELGSGTSYTCDQYPEYTGSSWLNVNSNEDQAYSGSASLGGLNISAQLIWCGSLAVTQHVNVNSQGEFVMIGSLATGQKSNENANSGSSLIVNSKMIVDGSLVVYGDLIVNSGGSLEFTGSSSSIAVYGSVTVNNGGEIVGSYTDVTGNVK